MKRLLVASSMLLLPTLVLIGCSHNLDLTRPASQLDFGVEAAKMNLWREAQFRFQRAVQLNPADAMAHNNLAVAYEGTGDYEKARANYVEALRLDKSNEYIQKNYSRFTEFISKNKKRERKAPVATRPSTAAAPAAPATGTTAAAPAPASASPSDRPPTQVSAPPDAPKPAAPPPGGQSPPTASTTPASSSPPPPPTTAPPTPPGNSGEY